MQRGLQFLYLSNLRSGETLEHSFSAPVQPQPTSAVAWSRQTFQFNLDIGIGTRYFLAEHWSINLGCRYQHVSNANTGTHNLGINAIGPLLGVSYFF